MAAKIAGVEDAGLGIFDQESMGIKRGMVYQAWGDAKFAASKWRL